MNQQSGLSSSSERTRVRYVMLGWFCSLSMITYIDRVCIMSLGSDMRRDLNLDTTQFGFVFASFALAYALFEVPSGWLGDRFGARKVLSRIVLSWSVFTALTGAVWNFLSLLVVRFLFGVGEAGAYPNLARGARNWFPFRERGFAQGMIWMFGRWGGAVAPVVVGALAVFLDWRWVFVVLGTVGILWLIGFTAYYRDAPSEHPNVSDAEREWIQNTSSGSPAATAPLAWSATLRSPTLWWLSFMYFCSNAGWAFFITWSKDYLEKDLGLQDMRLAVAAGSPLLFGGLACFLGGFLTDRQVRRWGRKWGRSLQAIVANALAGGFFLLALVLTDVYPGVAFACLCLASFFKDFAMPASWATTLDIGHRYSGTVAGIMNSVGNLGSVVSPPIVAALAQDSWKPALIYSAVMFFVSASCWFFIEPRRVIVYSANDCKRLSADGALD
jgi:MFS transporter, ACS family, glucarate transporter